MEAYELGKDVQEIKDRLGRIENAISACTATKCVACSPAHAESERSPTMLGVNAISRPFTIGRMDAGECECREQTLTVHSDGRFTHIAVHHNHSRFPDDGDTHRLTIHIRAGDEIVHSFSSEQFVPRGRDRTKQVDGTSDNVQRRYDDITHFVATLECD